MVALGRSPNFRSFPTATKSSAVRLRVLGHPLPCAVGQILATLFDKRR